MLISHNKKFIFLHNYKVAGTSIRQSLKPHCQRSYREVGLIDKLKFSLGFYPPIYSNNFDGHVTAQQLKNSIPDKIFESYYKFGFVRNPWDWQVSLYRFMLKDTSHHQHHLITKMKDFDEYIDWRVHSDLHLQNEFFYFNSKCLVDYIGKLESVHENFDHISKKLGVNINLLHLNKSRDSKDDYLKYYTTSSFNVVADAFKEDINLFGYEGKMKEDLNALITD